MSRPATTNLVRSARNGFSSLDLITSLAFLVIVLGLAVSLARYVRDNASERVTQSQLKELELSLYDDPVALEIESPPQGANEAVWAEYFARVNETVVRKLKSADGPVLDAWGNPIGFLYAGRSEIGMAPHDRPFCFSAGPDGKYLTRDDNLYSYEQISTPGTDTPVGGHSE